MKNNPKKQFTIAHRLIHWLLAILISLSFITGFLRMQWMGKKAVIAAVQGNSDLTKDQAVTIYKTLREPMWQWHVYAAYFIIILFVARLIYMAVKGIRFPNPFAKGSTARQKLQGWTYVLFYIFVGVQAVTGIYLKQIGGDLKPSMEAIHKLAIYWFPIFIVLHFGGVILDELSGKKGIVSKMIGGE